MSGGCRWGVSAWKKLKWGMGLRWTKFLLIFTGRTGGQPMFGETESYEFSLFEHGLKPSTSAELTFLRIENQKARKSEITNQGKASTKLQTFKRQKNQRHLMAQHLWVTSWLLPHHFIEV